KFTYLFPNCHLTNSLWPEYYNDFHINTSLTYHLVKVYHILIMIILLTIFSCYFSDDILLQSKDISEIIFKSVIYGIAAGILYGIYMKMKYKDKTDIRNMLILVCFRYPFE